MSDDLDEIERLARAVEEANAAILAARSGSATITQAALYGYAAARTVYEETLTPARVLALVARLRRAERVVEAARKVSEADERVLSAYRVPVDDVLAAEEREQLAAEHAREDALSALTAALSSEPSHG